MAERVLASATSDGSLPDHQDVGPTGTTAGESSPSFWDAVLKPRSASAQRTESGGKKVATSNWLGWLGGGRGANASASSMDAEHGAHSDDNLTPHPTAGVPRRYSNEPGATGGDQPEVLTPPLQKNPLPPSRAPAGAASPVQTPAPPPIRTASSSSVSGAELARPPLPMSKSDSSSELAPAASPGISCMECQMPIQGAIFMLHDQAYCCQRHRLVAYHKNEKSDRKGGSGSAAAAAPAPLTPHVEMSASPRPTTGLRASFSSWM